MRAVEARRGTKRHQDESTRDDWRRDRRCARTLRTRCWASGRSLDGGDSALPRYDEHDADGRRRTLAMLKPVGGFNPLTVTSIRSPSGRWARTGRGRPEIAGARTFRRVELLGQSARILPVRCGWRRAQRCRSSIRTCCSLRRSAPEGAPLRRFDAALDAVLNGVLLKIYDAKRTGSCGNVIGPISRRRC